MGVTDLPTTLQLERAARAFDTSWGAVDEVLYGICERHPDHSDRRAVTAKIALIDRAYSAGLERQVKPDEGEQAIVKIAAFMLDHASEVDQVIAGLDALREPLDRAAMTVIVHQHGRFTTLLRPVTERPTSPRSFAAKYLTFTAQWCRSTTATRPSASTHSCTGMGGRSRFSSLPAVTTSTGTSARASFGSTTGATSNTWR